MDEFLQNLETFARQTKVPVIVPTTREYLVNLVKARQPKRILEIGTAIGFSGSCFLKACPDAFLTTLEASTPNIAMAKQNFEAQGLTSRVNIIEGDCMRTLPTLVGQKFDFIFLDGPKGMYLDMIDMLLPLLADNGIWVSDNVLFRGMVLDGVPILEPRFQKTVNLMRQFLKRLDDDEQLSTQVLHIGDGLSVVEKRGNK